MQYGLEDEVLKQIREVFFKYPKVKSVILYGFRAKGNYKKGSDIDLTLLGEDLNILDLHKIELELDELYLPYSFDLSVFDKIENIELSDHINRVGKTIFTRLEYNVG